MIISFQHRFVFVAIPKTATHAFRVALRPHLAAGDWEQCGLFEQRSFPLPPLAQIGHGHLTCQEVRPFFPPASWDGLWRFCTVRNPYDRFASTCCFINGENDRMRQDPLGTMKQTIQDPQAVAHVLFRPQCEFVVDEDGHPMVHYVSRFEALQDHFDRICQRLRLPPGQLVPVNVSGSSRYRSCYDRELRELVQNAYQRDFAMFGYPMDLRN